MPTWYFLSFLCLFAPSLVQGREDSPPREQPSPTVEKLAAEAKKSIVVILYTGRDGRQVGLGTGFVVGKEGLIATNFHVIGEARPITVQLPDGAKHEVTVRFSNVGAPIPTALRNSVIAKVAARAARS